MFAPLVSVPMVYDPSRHPAFYPLARVRLRPAGVVFRHHVHPGPAAFFGRVANAEMRLNATGRMVRSVWEGLPRRFPWLILDRFVLMPDHFHGIVEIGEQAHVRGEHKVRPSGDGPNRPIGPLIGTLGRVIQAFKSITTHKYVMGIRHWGWPPFNGRLWQRNYHDRVIRDGQALERIRDYLEENPRSGWISQDCLKGDRFDRRAETARCRAKTSFCRAKTSLAQRHRSPIKT